MFPISFPTLQIPSPSPVSSEERDQYRPNLLPFFKKQPQKMVAEERAQKRRSLVPKQKVAVEGHPITVYGNPSKVQLDHFRVGLSWLGPERIQEFSRGKIPAEPPLEVHFVEPQTFEAQMTLFGISDPKSKTDRPLYYDRPRNQLWFCASKEDHLFSEAIEGSVLAALDFAYQGLEQKNGTLQETATLLDYAPFGIPLFRNRMRLMEQLGVDHLILEKFYEISEPLRTDTREDEFLLGIESTFNRKMAQTDEGPIDLTLSQRDAKRFLELFRRTQVSPEDEAFVLELTAHLENHFSPSLALLGPAPEIAPVEQIPELISTWEDPQQRPFRIWVEKEYPHLAQYVEKIRAIVVDYYAGSPLGKTPALPHPTAQEYSELIHYHHSRNKEATERFLARCITSLAFAPTELKKADDPTYRAVRIIGKILQAKRDGEPLGQLMDDFQETLALPKDGANSLLDSVGNFLSKFLGFEDQIIPFAIGSDFSPEQREKIQKAVNTLNAQTLANLAEKLKEKSPDATRITLQLKNPQTFRQERIAEGKSEEEAATLTNDLYAQNGVFLWNGTIVVHPEVDCFEDIVYFFASTLLGQGNENQQKMVNSNIQAHLKEQLAQLGFSFEDVERFKKIVEKMPAPEEEVYANYFGYRISDAFSQVLQNKMDSNSDKDLNVVVTEEDIQRAHQEFQLQLPEEQRFGEISFSDYMAAYRAWNRGNVEMHDNRFFLADFNTKVGLGFTPFLWNPTPAQAWTDYLCHPEILSERDPKLYQLMETFNDMVQNGPTQSGDEVTSSDILQFITMLASQRLMGKLGPKLPRPPTP
jgi:hypothetical protein